MGPVFLASLWSDEVFIYFVALQIGEEKIVPFLTILILGMRLFKTLLLKSLVGVGMELEFINSHYGNI